MNAAAALVAGAAAAYLGLWWPDVDLWFGVHRSGLSHGLLLPLAVLVAGRGRSWAVVLAAGLALGIGIHCAADLFPRSMRGLATIKLPFAGSIGATGSYVWLGVTTALGLVVPLRLVALAYGAAALGVAATGAAVMAAGYIVLHAEPLATVGAVGGALAVAHPAGRRRVVAGLSRLANTRSRTP